MSKYQIRPLSSNRKADIVRSVLADQGSTPTSAPTKSNHTRSSDEATGMLNRAFRLVTKG